MDLINDQQGHSLDIAPGLPASTDPVPLLGRGHYQVSIGHSSHVRGDVSCQLNNSTIENVNSLSQQPYNRKWSRSTQHSSDDAVNIYNITNYTWTYKYNLFLYNLLFSQFLLYPDFPILHSFSYQGFQWSYIHSLKNTANIHQNFKQYRNCGNHEQRLIQPSLFLSPLLWGIPWTL